VGTLNGAPDDLVAAVAAAGDQGVAPPCAAQLPYNLLYRSAVEGPDPPVAGVAVVASAVLAGGALTGRYGVRPGAGGRLAGRLGDERLRPALAAGDALAALAAGRGRRRPLAIAFALAGPAVASVLFGATSPAQVDENVGALDVLSRLGEDGLAALRAVGAPGPGA
jgi:aryl-alcohol dehydrogenase-like predicted oxidoreductase